MRVRVLRQPSRHANGNTLDHHGRLLTCEHSGRRIAIQEKDGTVRTLVDSFEGKKFNSPNDVVVKSDGSVWFSDPTFGILGYYEGHKAPSENKPAVYRLDPATGKEVYCLFSPVNHLAHGDDTSDNRPRKAGRARG